MRESYLAARVLDALLREGYGDLPAQITRGRGGVGLTLADGRLVRLAAGVPFQDFVVAPGQLLGLEQVLDTLAEIAPEQDAEGVKAFFDECVSALAALESHDARLAEVLACDPSYETLAAFAEHPGYPTARARPGLPDAETAAYAPEFGPSFALRWAAVPQRMLEPGSADRLPADVLTGPARADEVVFPVHPLAVDEVRRGGGRVLDEAGGIVRPVASMRAVEVGPRTHLVLPLPVSVLGARDRLTVGPDTLVAAARAEALLRALSGPDVLVAGEQEYARAGHECLAWKVRRLPEGRRVPVTALALPDLPGEAGARVRARLDDEVGWVLPGYLRVLLRWSVRLLVEYGVVPAVRWHEVALLLDDSATREPVGGAEKTPPGDGRGVVRLVVQGHEGVLVSPVRLAEAGFAVPELPERMVSDDPHALADAFVTGPLHLGAAAVAFAVLPPAGAAALLRRTLEETLRPYGERPMAKLLRARTLEAARLTGRAWLTAGTLAREPRDDAGPPRVSGPNYLRPR